MSDESGGTVVPSAESSTPSVESQDNSAELSGQVGSESSDQVSAIEEAVENGDLTPKEAKSLIKKFQLKVRGQMVEREVDLGDEDYIRNQLQLAEVSRLSMQEKAEQERQFERLLQSAKSDPMAFLAQLGLDPDELSAVHIEKKIEHLKKSPEQIEREKEREEIKQLREEAKKLKEDKENAEMSKLQQEAMSGLQNEISDAIKAHTKLPNTKYVQEKMAKAMHWASQNGFPKVRAEDVADVVEHEMRQELNSLFDQMPDDAIELYAGRKSIERLRNSKIAKVKAAPSLSSVKPTAAGVIKREEKKPEERIHAKDFWRKR